MENSKRIAWLSVEIPSKDGTRGMVGLQNFRGVPCMTDYEAEVNVSKLAIFHLMSRLNIWVKDISYDPLIETSRHLITLLYVLVPVPSDCISRIECGEGCLIQCPQGSFGASELHLCKIQ